MSTSAESMILSSLMLCMTRDKAEYHDGKERQWKVALRDERR